MFLTIYMHQFGWLSERGGNFLNLYQKEGVPRKREGRGVLSEKGGFQPWRKLLLKQTCSQRLQLFLNMYDLFLAPGLKGLRCFPLCYEFLYNFIEIWIRFGSEEKGIPIPKCTSKGGCINVLWIAFLKKTNKQTSFIIHFRFYLK